MYCFILTCSKLCLFKFAKSDVCIRPLFTNPVTYILVHKRTSILTFEGLSTTFEASTNVYFTYFCHKIKCYNGNICVKVASKMFSSQLGTHVQLLAI